MRATLPAVLAAAFLLGRGAHAGPNPPTFLVTSGADAPDANPGDGVCETSAGNKICTLRAAIMEANQTTGATIQIPAITITLTLGPQSPGNNPESGDLDVTSSMTIVGAGPGKTIVSANQIDQVFYVGQGNTATLSGLTVRDGTRGVQAYQTTLNVVNCEITHNGLTSSDPGGGLYDVESAVTITNSVFSDCHTTASGGAIASLAGALTISGTTFSGNSAAYGGAIYGPSATISACTFDGNSATAEGGAIHVDGAFLDVLQSTFSGNGAGTDGGAVFSATLAPIRFYGCTFTGNQADADFNGSGVGGAIRSGGSTALANSILADNWETIYFPMAGYLQAGGECAGAFTSSYSVVRVKPAGCTVTGTYAAVDPLLGPLQANGGPTKTRALLSGSPAIDAGNPGGCTDPLGAPLLTDQRGAKRQIGVRCDIGAYERGPCGDVNGDGTVNVADVFFLINHLFAGGAPPPGLANVNGGPLDVSDVFFLVNYLFANGSAPSCAGT